MVDFRSKAEKARDKEKQHEQEEHLENEARETLKVLAPEIRDYRAEVEFLTKTVLELRTENETLHETLTETLKTQMLGVEEVKAILIEKMENLTNDLNDVHRKISAVADSDMKLVQQLNDNQQQRLNQLSEIASGSN